MENNGWIKLYRKAKDNGIMKDHIAWTLLCWIMLSVNRKTGIYKTGRFVLADALACNGNTIYKALKRLEKKYRMVTLSSNNKMTEIRLLNWAKYQGDDEPVTQLGNIPEKKGVLVTTNNSHELEANGNNAGNNKVTTKQQQSNTIKNIYGELRIKNKENINIYGKAQKITFSAKEFERPSSNHHGFTTPLGETSKAYKESTQAKSGIHTEWQEKAFRYASQLGIDLEVTDDKGRSIKPRWLKVFKDAQNGIRFINLERATSYLIDYKKPLSSQEKIKLFFWVYANNKKMEGNYATTD